MDEADRQRLIEKAEHTHQLTETELSALLADNGADDAMAEAADRVRRAYVGDEVHLRGLIEFRAIAGKTVCTADFAAIIRKRSGIGSHRKKSSRWRRRRRRRATPPWSCSRVKTLGLRRSGWQTSFAP